MFTWARIKLTVWYSLIIMLVSIMFSAVIYRAASLEVERFVRIQRFRFNQVIIGDEDLITEVRQRILTVLVLVNSGILVVAAGLAYFLAGRTLKPIAQMVDEQYRFTSDASHELKTPLTSLKSGLEVYLRNTRPTLKEAKELVGESIQEVNKLQTLTESLLQLAQYQTPNGQIKFAKLHLDQITTAAVRAIAPIAHQKQISISCKTDDIKLSGHSASLVELLVIMLDNAIKYSPRGSRVNLTATRNDGSAEITIADQGPGIDKKDLPHIFDRFYRSDAARTKADQGGYGLGLAIAQKIVNLHHGSITATSAPHQGSAFTIRIPSAFS